MLSDYKSQAELTETPYDALVRYSLYLEFCRRFTHAATIGPFIRQLTRSAQASREARLAQNNRARHAA